MPNTSQQDVEDPRITARRLELQDLLIKCQVQVVSCLQTQKSELGGRFRGLTNAGQSLIMEQCVTDVYHKCCHIVHQLQSPLPSETVLCNELYVALGVNIAHPEAVVL